MHKVKKNSGLVSIRGHHFYASLINSNSTVVDLGSHLGEFSIKVSDIFGCRCYAVEALSSLYDRIPETHLIKKFNYAIASKNLPVQLCVTHNPEGNYVDQGLEGDGIQMIAIEGIAIESFMNDQNLEIIDLLKVDIEGSEINMFDSLSDENLDRIKQITVEFHDFKFPILAKVESIKERLKKLGFTCVIYSRNHHGDVLFINNKKCHLGFLTIAYIKYVSRYSRGFLKVVNRLLKRKSLGML